MLLHAPVFISACGETQCRHFGIHSNFLTLRCFLFNQLLDDGRMLPVFALVT
jgi:hypothetical protein